MNKKKSRTLVIGLTPKRNHYIVTHSSALINICLCIQIYVLLFIFNKRVLFQQGPMESAQSMEGVTLVYESKSQIKMKMWSLNCVNSQKKKKEWGNVFRLQKYLVALWIFLFSIYLIKIFYQVYANDFLWKHVFVGYKCVFCGETYIQKFVTLTQ